MTIKLYKPVKRYKLELVWSTEVCPSLKQKGWKWFRAALDKEVEDIDSSQMSIREQFPLSGVGQGDLICVGGSQCYLM